jgi:hypothetical protein
MNGYIHLTGNQSNELITAMDVAFNPAHLIADSSKNILKSDLYINASSYPDFVATKIDMSESYTMHLQNVRIGSNSYAKTKVISNNDTIYFNDYHSNDQYFM